MTEMIEQQSEAFLACVTLGVGIGFLTGCFSALKKVIPICAGAQGLADVIFWLALCGVVAWTIFTYNNGELRFYLFLGIFSGIGIYFSTINWVVSRLLNYILRRMKNGYKKVVFGAKKLVDIICSKR